MMPHLGTEPPAAQLIRNRDENIDKKEKII